MTTKTVSEWQDEFQKQDGELVPAPQLGTPANLAPPARLIWLRSALAELSLPTDWLAPAEALAVRATEMRRDAALASQQAQVRRAGAQNSLATDPEATVAGVAEMWAAQGIWLDVPQGMTRPVALQLAEDGARQIEGALSA
jgi:hypothetical protein